MNHLLKTIRFSSLALGAILASAPLSAAPAKKDSTHAAKPADQKEAHDHDHEGHAGHGEKGKEKGHEGEDHGHKGHGKEATGTGKTNIKEISSALRENLACLEKELASAEHTGLHSCLETIEALGIDLIALKSPSDPSKKKRVNGYAKNLGRMAHQVDEYLDAKKPDNAKAQLKKLTSQVELIEGQFEEFAKKPAGK